MNTTNANTASIPGLMLLSLAVINSLYFTCTTVRTVCSEFSAYDKQQLHQDVCLHSAEKHTAPLYTSVAQEGLSLA